MASKTVAFMAVCLVLGFAAESKGTVIYSTIPSNNSYNSTNSYAVSGSSTSWNELDIAARFVVPSISDRYLDNIEVACRSYSSSNISDITVMITADNSEYPGTVLATKQVTAPASSAIVTADFANNLQLTAGSAYWVRVSTVATSGQVFWHISQPKRYDGACKWSGNNGQSWNGYSSELPAFRVNSVPEPATVLLLGIGALCLVNRRK